MTTYPPTCIIRHRRENLNKCSLSGLETREDLVFVRYPLLNNVILPINSSYFILDFEGEPISAKDQNRGFVLIDATWKLADKIYSNIPVLHTLEKRSIPRDFKTAYPRRQEDCKDPLCGLASIEALFIAYTLLGRESLPLLDGYYWKEQFLDKNSHLFTQSKK